MYVYLIYFKQIQSEGFSEIFFTLLMNNKHMKAKAILEGLNGCIHLLRMKIITQSENANITLMQVGSELTSFNRFTHHIFNYTDLVYGLV